MHWRTAPYTGIHPIQLNFSDGFVSYKKLQISLSLFTRIHKGMLTCTSTKVCRPVHSHFPFKYMYLYSVHLQNFKAHVLICTFTNWILLSFFFLLDGVWWSTCTCTSRFFPVLFVCLFFFEECSNDRNWSVISFLLSPYYLYQLHVEEIQCSCTFSWLFFFFSFYIGLIFFNLLS